MFVSANAARKALHSSSAQARSAHRLAIFVKICIAVAPIALARGGASRVPPAIETCAPSKSDVAAADFRWADSRRAVERALFAAGGGLGDLRRCLGRRPSRCSRSAIVFFLPSAQDLAAAWAVQRHLVVIIAQIIVPAAAGAFALERLMAAHDTIPVVHLVAAKARADGASLDRAHRSLLAFATEPARRIDGGSTVSDLEVKMGRQVGIGNADGANLVALNDSLTQTDIGAGE